MKHRSLRLAAGASTLAVAAGLLAGTPASADGSPSSSYGASWLNADLQDNGLFPDGFGGFDIGLNLDAGYAFLQSGKAAEAASQRSRIEPQTDAYITGEAFGDTGSTYANATAKLLAFVEASGGNPAAYAGKNLVTRLEAQVSDGAGEIPAGELFDTSTFGNFANTIGQSFAAQGLEAVGSAQAAPVLSHLLAQQCADGHFPLNFRTPSDDSCTDTASVDVTALVLTGVRDLVAKPGVASAVQRAAGFIASKQAADGSFVGAPPTDTPNTNSTGLAAWALGEACLLPAATKAAAWTRALQVPASQTGPLAVDKGAIAYDRTALERDTTDGIAADERDQYRRATAQATNGLSYDPAAVPQVGLTAPTGYVKGGSKVTLTVTGIASSDAPCFTSPSGVSAILPSTAASVNRVVTVPNTTTTLRWSATTGPGVRTAAVKVLGPKTLTVQLRKQVRRAKKQQVRVPGLAAGEKVRVFLAGKQVAAGTANASGLFVREFTVKRGVQLGQRSVRVVGEFGTRTGRKNFKVLPAR